MLVTSNGIPVEYWTQRIRKATVTASNWHDGQKRKEANVPYNAHLWGVSLLLALSRASEDVIIAGIFHDIFEDTPMKPEQLGWHFGANVLDMVRQVTEPKGLAWKDRKQEMLKRITGAKLDVKMIKCADKIDNLQSLFEATKAEGYRLGWDNSKAKVWQSFHGGYNCQKWYNQNMLQALFENVRLNSIPPLFGTYMRLVESVFKEKVINDTKARNRVRNTTAI